MGARPERRLAPVPLRRSRAAPASSGYDLDMGETSDFKAAAKTWQSMVDSNQALLLRKSGHDVHWWAEAGRAKGLTNDGELRDWMREQHGITGYAQYAVSWEMFGYPEFMLRDADELIDGPTTHRRPIRQPPPAAADCRCLAGLVCGNRRRGDPDAQGLRLASQPSAEVRPDHPGQQHHH